MNHDFILLDRSGSMITLWTEALGSINGYVKKLAETKADTGVTLVMFDAPQGQSSPMDFTVIRERIIPSTWHDVNVAEIQPRGFTPLNDAVARIVALADAGNYANVAIIIMTDGMENASREYKLDAVKAMLDVRRGRGWQIVFLGVNFENMEQAKGYGAMAGAAYATSAHNVRATMTSTASLRSSNLATGACMSFTDEDKAQLDKQK